MESDEAVAFDGLMERVADLLEVARVALLSTVDASGRPRARWMTTPRSPVPRRLSGVASAARPSAKAAQPLAHRGAEAIRVSSPRRCRD